MTTSPPDRAPVAAALLCFVLWGLYPLMFQWVAALGVSPFEMLAGRMLTAAPFAAGLVLLTGQARAFAALLRRPKEVAAFLFAGAIMGANWGVYIWAVSNHQTLAASLGYYINPLLNVSVAALVFRERIDRLGWVALGLAAVGVALQTWAMGAVPWIALILASTFCIYGMVRKTALASSQNGLLLETLVMMAPAAIYMGVLSKGGGATFGVDPMATFGVIVTGASSVIPLALYGYAARRVSFTALAFFQFISPSIIFVIGALQGEPLNALRLASFGFIWAGVAVFVYGAVQVNKKATRSGAGRDGPIKREPRP